VVVAILMYPNFLSPLAASLLRSDPDRPCVVALFDEHLVNHRKE